MNRPSTGAGRALVLVAALAVGCGKKGPPLPPLVRLPIAPPTIAAERIGDTVAVTFTVPDTNTDRTKPANIDRVDVYAITAPPSISDAQLLKHATKIGSVAVKSPKDPNAVVDEDEQDEEMEPAVGAGLDQGAVAHVDEQLTRQAFVNADLASDDRKRPAPAADAPLVGPPTTLPARTYVAVGVSARGKKGPLSKRVTAPLIEPPATPRDLRLSYTEQQVDLSWSPVAASAPAGGVLPSRPLGTSAPSIGYNVYDVSSSTPQKVNKEPLTETRAADPRIVFGEKRCYVVRAVALVSGAAVESESSPSVCDTLVDTFPPAAPKGLRSVAGERTISLIWDPNTEPDLAGYIVYRGTSPTELQAITPAAIPDTNFADTVQAGVRYFYAVKAVDKAGNASPFSERVDETARE
ncbi:MAG TPA: hypothetical protein VFA27_14105 [Vicinamibacterales bacterium]|nr:hypothetical protein [Vicinamibacterales bacterium]